MGKYIAIILILIFVAELVFYIYLKYKNKKIFNETLETLNEIVDNEAFRDFMDCDKL